MANEVDDLVFAQKVELAKLMNDLRNSPPMGVVGMLEFRNMLANMFPEFSDVRDPELDTLLTNYIDSIIGGEEKSPLD